MTAAELQAIAIRLVGEPGWQSKLARRLGCARTTVARWVALDHVPEPVAVGLQALDTLQHQRGPALGSVDEGTARQLLLSFIGTVAQCNDLGQVELALQEVLDRLQIPVDEGEDVYPNEVLRALSRLGVRNLTGGHLVSDAMRELCQCTHGIAEHGRPVGFGFGCNRCRCRRYRSHHV